MIIFKYEKIEELLWASLLLFQIATWLFFTHLQSYRYYSEFLFVVEMLSWPISILLLFYFLKGRLIKQDNQLRLIIFATLGAVFGVLISYMFLLLTVLYFISLIFFFIVLVISGLKLLKELKFSSL